MEGLDVLEWIPKTAVPAYKTVTYPQYTTAVRPEKDKNTEFELQLVETGLNMKVM